MEKRYFHSVKDGNPMQDCGVGGKMSDSDLSKISHFDFLTQREWNWAVNNFVATSNHWYTTRIIWFIKAWKEIVPFQQAQVKIPNLGVWCKIWFNWTSGVGLKVWLRLLVLLGIQLRLHPKTSDSLRLRHRLHNPDPMTLAHKWHFDRYCHRANAFRSGVTYIRYWSQ